MSLHYKSLQGVSWIQERVFSSEALCGMEVVPMKLNLSHVSGGVPLKQLLAFKHICLQHIHVPDLNTRQNKTEVNTLMHFPSSCVCGIFEQLVCTMMNVDWELVELNTNPICKAWILIFTVGGALMRTRQVWFVLEVVGFSKIPLGEKSWMSQSVQHRQYGFSAWGQNIGNSLKLKYICQTGGVTIIYINEVQCGKYL